MPLFGLLGSCLDFVWIPRGSSTEEKQAVLDTISNRQAKIAENGDQNRVMIYAEGGVTNNSGIIKFKKGPFATERTVSPTFMKFDRPGFSLAYNMPIGPLVIMQYCRGFTTC